MPERGLGRLGKEGERKGGFRIASEEGEIKGCSQQKPFQPPFPRFSGPDDIVSRKNDTIVCRDARFSSRLTEISLLIARKMRAAALIQQRIARNTGWGLGAGLGEKEAR
jgi:hypothetical protein